MSDIFTDFQKSERYTPLWKNELHPPSVKPCFPGNSE
jgi:hypothetical protein